MKDKVVPLPPNFSTPPCKKSRTLAHAHKDKGDRWAGPKKEGIQKCLPPPAHPRGDEHLDLLPAPDCAVGPLQPQLAPLSAAHNTQDWAGSSRRTRRAKRKRFWWCRETPAPPGRHRRHHHRTGADTERPISRCGGGSPATPTLPPHTPCALIAFPDQRRALRPYLREIGSDVKQYSAAGRLRVTKRHLNRCGRRPRAEQSEIRTEFILQESHHL